MIPALVVVFLVVVIATEATFTGPLTAEDSPNDSSGSLSDTSGYAQVPSSVPPGFYALVDDEGKPIYPVNENGQTYGMENPYIYVGQTPDLIAAVGIDGTEGYIYNSIQDQHGGHPPPQNPEEALEYMEWLNGRY